MRRSLAGLAALAMVITACGDGTLTKLGSASEWVHEAQSTEVTAIEVAPEGGAGSIDVITWYNGWAEDPETDRDKLIEAVWAETDGEDAFVQATPNEIAIAIPGIKVPADLPSDVVQVTSQIVYALSTGALDNTYVAAFGFWIDEPYKASREIAQVASLQVAYDDSTTIDPNDPAGGCARFLDRNFSNCRPAEILEPLAWWVTTIDGVSLIWIEGGFRYELLKRSKLSIEDAETMALSLIPLDEVLPSTATLAVDIDPRS